MQETIFISLPLSQLQILIIDCVNACLDARIDQTPQQETDRWFDLTELCDYLPDKPAKATLYNYVSTNTIPFHKGFKKLRFLKSEIDAWLKQGRKKIISDIEADTDIFLNDSIRKRKKL